MSLLQKILGLEYNDIINYQIKRKKIKFNSGDRFFFELFINHPLLQRAVMQNHTLTLEYLHGEPGSLEVRDISKFPEIPLLLYTSFAFAPHLASIGDVAAGVIGIGSLPGHDFVYGPSKRSNFTDYGVLLGLVLKYFGAFPIGRGSEVAGEQFSEIKTLTSFINSPDKHIGIAIEGTRQSSGRPGTAQGGLEKFIKKHIEKTGIQHTVVPMAVSIDAIASPPSYFLTFCDPISFGKENLHENFMEQVFNKIKESMKVTYNHVASTFLIEYAASRDRDFMIDEDFMEQLYSQINRYIAAHQASKKINLDARAIHNTKNSFNRFIQFCKDKEILYYDQKGYLYANVSKLHFTFEMYEKEKLPSENLSLTEQGEHTRYFRKEHPLPYMEGMTRHIIGEEIRNRIH